MLAKNILATLAYYDIFDYPMTGFEIWKYLLRNDGGRNEGQNDPIRLEDVMRELEEEYLKERIACQYGLYYLHGRESLIQGRLSAEKSSIAKLKGVRRLVFWLRSIPFIRMVALTGSLAMKNSEQNSDWDFFIVLRSRHIWTGRAITTVLLHLFGKRRHGKKTKDRACLNYWITTDSLEIITKDLFSSNEYFFCIPFFGFDQFQRFQTANSWIYRFRPQYETMKTPHMLSVPDSFPARFIRDFFEILLSDPWFENKLRVWQKKKIESNPKTRLPGSLIEASDKALIFLPKPQGPRIFEKFKQRLTHLHVHAS